MIKSWLIKTSAPFFGTEQYYRAYSKENPLMSGNLDDWFWDEETMKLWYDYGYSWENNFESDFEEVRGGYYDSYDDFYEDKIQEWREECSIDCEECPEENFIEYVPGGKGELEIIYDERK